MGRTGLEKGRFPRSETEPGHHHAAHGREGMLLSGPASRDKGIDRKDEAGKTHGENAGGRCLNAKALTHSNNIIYSTLVQVPN